MGIVFFEALDDVSGYLEGRFPGEHVRFVTEALAKPEQLSGMAADTDILSVFVMSRVTAEIIDALPNLRMIATRSTGFDHIDASAAAERGIIIANVPTYGENTVAEHTFALILSLSRNVHKAYMRTMQGDFSLSGLVGFDLKGRTIGIVGTGHIGLHVAKIANAFEMDVLATDVNPNQTMADVLGFRYTSLDDLLQRSDIVTLHVPLFPGTRHLIGERSIALMKPGAILINTARGELVDTGALLKALDEKRLGGAGLDVLEGETNMSEESMLRADPSVSREALQTTLRNLALLHRSDLVVTPHIGFDSREAINRILDMTVENIRAFRGGVPTNVVKL